MTKGTLGRKPFTMKATFACPGPQCGAQYFVSLQVLHAYLRGTPAECAKCRTSLDMFEIMIRSTDFFFSKFDAIGARTTHFQIGLKPGQVVKVDFRKRIGRDARILHVNYTSQSDGEHAVTAVEVHGNTPVRKNLPVVHLLGRPVPGTSPKFKGTVGVAVWWVPPSPDDQAWRSLVDAYEEFHEETYAAVVVPANVAVEARIGRLLDDFLRYKGFSKERVENFLTDGATYGHQLAILLPLIADMTRRPRMPEVVSTKLRALKKIRNEMAHGGAPDKPVTRQDAISYLVAATLASVYVDMIRASLRLRSSSLSKPRSGSVPSRSKQS